MSTGESKSDLYLVFVLTTNGTSSWAMKLREQGKLLFGAKKMDSMDISKQTFDEDFSYYEEDDIIDEAYYNAYLIITKRMTLEELIYSKGEVAFVPYDPGVPETLEFVLDDIIEYFASTEEYEICSELVKVKEKLNDT